MRRDISIIDRQMKNSVTAFLSLDFADAIPYIFTRCLKINPGDIISPRCFLTLSYISASLGLSNAIGIQVTLGRFTFESLENPVSLFDCIFTCVRKLWFIETFWYCRSLRNSLFCNVLQDISEQRYGIISVIHGRLVQTSAAQMPEFMPVCLRQLPCLNPIKRRWSIIIHNNWKVITTTWVRTNFPGYIKKR